MLPPQPSPGILTTWPRHRQWLVLFGLTVVLTALLEEISLPGALLIGPMVAAIAAGVGGATVRVPILAFNAAQAIIGCLIAGSIELAIFTAFMTDWPIISFAVISTVAASSFLGWSISRLQILPGTAGVWGSAPGASTAMVLMADAFGADTRLVAFMLYLRVIMVTIAAALVAGLWVDTSAVPRPALIWFPEIIWPAFLSTLAVAAAGSLLGRLMRIPSPYFLGTFVLAIALHLGGLVQFQLPQWLLATSYVAVGWTIGLRFERGVLLHAARALPQIMLSILLLIGFCGGIAWVLANELGVDPLTAYLATSPGGLDSIAIIAAASSNVNLSLVMALQTARFLFVLVVGPPLARMVARSLGEPKA